MPEFGGLRVVQVKRGDSFVTGDLIAWDQFSIRSTQSGAVAFVKVDRSKQETISVRGGSRGSRLAARLKHRHGLGIGVAPELAYEPKHESVLAHWALVALCGIAPMLFLIHFIAQSLLGMRGQSWQTYQFLASVPVVLVGCMLIANLWLLLRTRPRTPQFKSVVVTDTEIRLESVSGDLFRIPWSSVTGHKFVRGNPSRMRFDSHDGRCFWIAIPGHVRHSVLARIPEACGGVRPVRFVTMRSQAWFIARLLGLGFVAAGGTVVVFVWLRNTGHLLPADFAKILWPCVGMVLFLSWGISILYLWCIWRQTPKGRRTARRWSRHAARLCRHQ